MGFHRLAIMGLHEESMQPFKPNGNTSVYSGVTFRPIKDALSMKYCSRGESDSRSFCRFTRNTVFRCSVCSTRSASRSITTPGGGSFVAARDPIGVCPLYYGYSESGNILLRASLRAVGLDRGSPPSHAATITRTAGLSLSGYRGGVRRIVRYVIRHFQEHARQAGRYREASGRRRARRFSAQRRP